MTGAAIMPAQTRTGSVLLPQPWQPFARAPSIDSRSAAAEALVEFLRCAQFCRWGGPEAGEDVPFRLSHIYRQWPEPSQPLVYPSASVIDLDDVPQQAHSLVPTPLDETYGLFGEGTVLWKTAEVATTFQVDLWAEDDPTREAMAALLPSLFAPGEDSWGIVVQGPPTYFGRAVRLSLLSSQRMDTAQAVYVRERRLMARVRAEVDEVHLRRATLASVRVGIPEECIGENVTTECAPKTACDEPCED